MKPLISIIIPIYNMENYIDDCLKSIISQENKDFEVILVNDGSNDNSKSICGKYVDKDKRFTLINKENGGVSSARNLGLQFAKGKFIIFIDADDFISEDYLTIDKEFYDCDIIEKSSLHIIDNNKIIRNYHKKNSIVINNKKKFLTHFVSNKNNALWDKFISREAIGDNMFDEDLKVGEDFIFRVSIAHRIKSYGISNKGIYYYRVHNSSTMQSITNDYKLYIDHLYTLIPKIYSNTQSLHLANSIAAKYNISKLFNKRSKLNNYQKKILEDLFNQIRYNDLYYLSLKYKIKFMIKKYRYRLNF